MTLLVPNVGEQVMLEAFLNKTAPSNLTIRLFTSNTTPAESDVASTYTEATGNGYNAQALTASLWSVTQGNPSNAAYPQVTFGFTGALGLVYGYFVTNAAGTLMWAERFAVAIPVQNNGDQIAITPAITLE